MSKLSNLSWFRAALAFAVIATAVAVGVARSQPPPRSSKVPVTESPVLISLPRRGSPLPPTVWMEGDPSRTTLLRPPGGMLLEFGIASPWRDEAGRFQVVGRLTGGENRARAGYVGLARVSFPDGELLDLVATDVLPTSQPCWARGTRPRILFAAADGHLYQHDFDGEGHAIPGAERPHGAQFEGPSRLAWHSPAPPPTRPLRDGPELAPGCPV